MLSRYSFKSRRLGPFDGVSSPCDYGEVWFGPDRHRYIKFLPFEFLPTFWSEEELELVEGTSLRPAIMAKMKSLNREYEELRKATRSISWCAKYWWGADGVGLTFDDWKQVDAMYRSRALEFPGIGDCMVPCIDMANHASRKKTAALYEAGPGGNGLLQLRYDKHVNEGDEITIT